MASVLVSLRMGAPVVEKGHRHYFQPSTLPAAEERRDIPQKFSTAKRRPVPRVELEEWVGYGGDW